MAEFLLALAQFDERRGWVDLGYSSFFDFLHRDLGLSKGAAHYRLTAARLVRKFPEVAEPLRDGRLCITSVVQLAKVLTPENRQDVLSRFFQKSKREAMAVAVAISPNNAAPRRDVITPVHPASSPAVAIATTEPNGSTDLDPDLVQPVEPDAAAPVLSAKPPPRDWVEPLTADLHRMHVTVSRRFLEKLEAARAALSHKLPVGTNEEILEAGLDLVLEWHAKRKGLVKRPRAEAPSQEPGAATGSYVPAAVRREVWKRDGGRCQWPLEKGGICGSTNRVEIDHRIPPVLGGASTKENLRLLCRFHNDLSARAIFGDAKMNQFTGKGASAGAAKRKPMPSG